MRLNPMLSDYLYDTNGWRVLLRKHRRAEAATRAKPATPAKPAGNA